MKYPRRSIALFMTLFLLLFSGCNATDAASSSRSSVASASTDSSVSAPDISSKVSTAEEVFSSAIPSSDTPSEPEELASLDRELDDYRDIRIELETNDYEAVLEAFVEAYQERSYAVPENNIYAIEDFIIREVFIDTEHTEHDALFTGILRFAVKPVYFKYFVRVGDATDGTGEFDGYILRGVSFHVVTEDNKTWTLL